MSTISEQLAEDDERPFYIPSNVYAGSFLSKFSHSEGHLLSDQDIDLIQHVNCSYLSSGTPPTLLALKQHAQSLTNLIRKLTISTKSVAINGKSTRVKAKGAEDMLDIEPSGEAFDWLEDLDTPYENGDESHHLPLWALVNQYESEDADADGIHAEHHCPLKQAPDSGPFAKTKAVRRPFLNHHTLVMHANKCLEILDHEYSATGGLLSLLPPAELDDSQNDSRELDDARNTLLGQWLLHTQHLVTRMHELELAYANALDVLAGEADVPLQLLRRPGPDAAGREVAAPQDRYVFANAGDDVFAHLHRLLDRADAVTAPREALWQRSGVVGERLVIDGSNNTNAAGEADEPAQRALVFVDVPTRFYRLREKGRLSTLFVVPTHPGVAHTRDMETKPAVVSVATPVWPERVSDWERRYQARLDEAKEIEATNQALVRERLQLQDALAVSSAELSRNRRDLAFYESSLGQDERQRLDALLQEVTSLRDMIGNVREKVPKVYLEGLDLNE